MTAPLVGDRAPSGGPPFPSPRHLGFRSIIHVNEKGGHFGGTEEYIDLLTAALARVGVRSHLVCGTIGGALAPELDSVQVVPGLASRTTVARTADDVAAAVARVDADVIYLHNVFDPAIVQALATLEHRRPLVWYVHDHYPTCLTELRWRRDHGACRQRLGKTCLDAIAEGRCVLRHADRSLGTEDLRQRESLSRSLALVDQIVVVSWYMRSVLADAEPGLVERIHVLPRPIRTSRAGRVRRHRAANEPAVVTFAGRITPEKGLAVVLEAVAAIRHPAPVDLRIAGVVEHPAYWSECQLMARRAMDVNPRARVTVLGELSYEATDELLRQSDIVTVPSQWPEPLGAVALEAMAAGAAVVASDIGGLGTYLNDGSNGRLVTADDPAAWTSAIETLVQRPDEARRLGHQASLDAGALTTEAHLDALEGVIRAIRRDLAGSA
ncbi:MAG: glycosyltransferase family 4 protein [Actinomycetota bacterium]|nr:glycosyltransferase family 4 protein [Actinomycetota bacterium]